MVSIPACGERRDGGADFRPAARGEAGIGSHQRDGVVAPVVGQAERGEVALVDPGGGGHDLDRGDAEPGQVPDGGGMRQAGEAPAQLGAGCPDGAGEAAHMQFVEHGLCATATSALPGGGASGAATIGLGHRGGAVGVIEAPVARGEHRWMQAKRPVDRDGVGVEQQLAGIEAMAVGGVDAGRARAGRSGCRRRTPAIWPWNTSPVRPGRRMRRGLAVIGVEQAELDGGGMGGEDRDVHAAAAMA